MNDMRTRRQLGARRISDEQGYAAATVLIEDGLESARDRVLPRVVVSRQ
jgi:hypothetical protein